MVTVRSVFGPVEVAVLVGRTVEVDVGLADADAVAVGLPVGATEPPGLGFGQLVWSAGTPVGDPAVVPQPIAPLPKASALQSWSLRSSSAQTVNWVTPVTGL
jgi:hypothetical protein